MVNQIHSASSDSHPPESPILSEKDVNQCTYGRGTIRFVAGLFHIIRGGIRILASPLFGRRFRCFAFHAGVCDFLNGCHHFKALVKKVNLRGAKDHTWLAVEAFGKTFFRSEIYPVLDSVLDSDKPVTDDIRESSVYFLKGTLLGKIH